MNIFKSAIIAISMFSRLPMPFVEWNKKNMQYSMCFFPLVGLIIGLFIGLWVYISKILNFQIILFISGIVVIPVIVTGGIHIDGFCDTIDALSSYGDKDKKLEILKDSHIGAFAVIGLIIYFIIYFGVVSEIIFDFKSLLCYEIIFILSRSLSGFAVAAFPCAKNSGLLYTFSDKASKKFVKVFLFFLCLILISLLFFISLYYALFIVVFGLICFFYYYKMSIKNFGGITGDLAGYFLQICEISMIFAIFIVQVLVECCPKFNFFL